MVGRENLGGVARGAVQREERIDSKIRISGLRTVIAVLADAGPAGEQRPYGSVMVSATAEFWRARGNDAHAPVGLVIDARKLRNHSTRIFLFRQAEPHGNGSEHTGFVDRFAVGSQREGIALFACRSEERRVGKECRSRWSPYH